MTEVCQNNRNLYNSTLSNKYIDNRGSNNLAEIHQQKTENSTSTLIDTQILIPWEIIIFLQDITRDFDIFLISVSKLDKSFSKNQFKIIKCLHLIETVYDR